MYSQFAQYHFLCLWFLPATLLHANRWEWSEWYSGILGKVDVLSELKKECTRYRLLYGAIFWSGMARTAPRRLTDLFQWMWLTRLGTWLVLCLKVSENIMGASHRSQREDLRMAQPFQGPLMSLRGFYDQSLHSLTGSNVRRPLCF